MLGYFNKCNNIKCFNTIAPSEVFYGIHNIFFDGISDNKDYVVQTSKYGAFNKDYTKNMGYSVAKYVSDTITLQK